MKTTHRALALLDLPQPSTGRTGWPWTKASVSLPQYMPDGSDWPRISVITPSYNQGQFLEETIRSVLLQGYPNLEYIVIDGGSTDNSVEIIKKYETHLTYWVSERDSGQSNALNKGLRQCNGEIVGWINSDDVYAKNTFRTIQRGFLENPEYVFIHGNRILIDANSNVIGWTRLPKFEPETLRYTICSETAFWRLEVIEKIGYFDENFHFAMDLDFFGRIYKHGSFLKLNEYLGYFRCHNNSKSSQLLHIRDREAEIIWQKNFGISNFREKALARAVNASNVSEKVVDLIRNPQLVGIPYALSKLKNSILLK